MGIFDEMGGTIAESRAPEGVFLQSRPEAHRCPTRASLSVDIAIVVAQARFHTVCLNFAKVQSSTHSIGGFWLVCEHLPHLLRGDRRL